MNLSKTAPVSLSTEVGGDRGLLVRVSEMLSEESPTVRDRLIVAVLDADQVQWASFGALRRTEFEIGSLTQTLTGALYAEAIARGEVTTCTPVGSLLALGAGPVAELPLEALATHTSGLPRLPGSDETVALLGLVGAHPELSPWHWDLDDLFAETETATIAPASAGEYSVSDLGFALLGHALAVAANLPFTELLEERMLRPLHLRTTRIPITDDFGELAARGHTIDGEYAEPWIMHAYSPAAGVRSTAEDLVAYSRALLDGGAPGADALLAHRRISESAEAGWGWRHSHGLITWQAGATGGQASALLLDREARRGVVVLSSTAAPVTELGMRLLLDDGL
jgi:CubicO group peptidase (beta-lactamase class C family)